MITLSTAEAELLSMIDGAIAMKGVEALLLDIGEVVEGREIASDSMAALSISSGSSISIPTRSPSTWIPDPRVADELDSSVACAETINKQHTKATVILEMPLVTATAGAGPRSSPPTPHKDNNNVIRA